MIAMERKVDLDPQALIGRISDVVREYIDNEEDYSDNVQLAINPSDLGLEIADPDDDLPELDYYPMMDLVRMSASEPGRWEPDTDAISDVASEYILTE